MLMLARRRLDEEFVDIIAPESIRKHGSYGVYVHKADYFGMSNAPNELIELLTRESCRIHSIVA